MQISCPHCRARYKLTEARLAALGSKAIRCRKCEKGFTVGGSTRPSSSFLLRIPGEDTLRQAGTFDTVKRWIIEGKLSGDTEVSGDGDDWRHLDDFPELASYFRLAARQERLSGGQTSVPPPPPPPAPSVSASAAAHGSADIADPGSPDDTSDEMSARDDDGADPAKDDAPQDVAKAAQATPSDDAGGVPAIGLVALLVVAAIIAIAYFMSR